MEYPEGAPNATNLLMRPQRSLRGLLAEREFQPIRKLDCGMPCRDPALRTGDKRSQFMGIVDHRHIVESG